MPSISGSNRSCEVQDEHHEKPVAPAELPEPSNADLDDDLAYFADQLREDDCIEVAKAPLASCVPLGKDMTSLSTDVARLFQRLYDAAVQTVREHGMIKDGDRVLVGLSGGKDSLTMLHILRRMSLKSNPVKFELAAATVDPLAEGFDPSPLIPYVEQLGIPYFYERQNIIEQAKFRNVSYSSEHPNDNRHTCAEQLPCRENGTLTKAEERELTSICAFCSRMKRGVLYGCARKNGFNVLALDIRHGWSFSHRREIAACQSPVVFL